MAQPGQPRGIGVSLTQVIGGVLASVSAAVVASYFGITGTLIGAATTSVVIIVGGALYQRTMERTQVRLVRIRGNPRTGGVTRAAVTAAAPAPARRRIRWGAVLGGLAAVLGLTFGALTAVELLAQEPLAAVVQQEPPPTGQTTLGVAVREAVHEVTNTNPPPAPTAAPTSPAVGTASPTAAAEPTPSATADVERTPTPSATGDVERTPTPARRTAVPTTTTMTPTVAPPPAPAAIPTAMVPTAGPTPPAASATPRPGAPAPP